MRTKTGVFTRAAPAPGSGGAPAEGRRGARRGVAPAGGQQGHEDEDDDGGQVFEDQPADGDAAVGGADEAAVGQAAQQDDGAGDGEGEAQHQPGDRRPAPQAAEGQPGQGGEGCL